MEELLNEIKSCQDLSLTFEEDNTCPIKYIAKSERIYSKSMSSEYLYLVAKDNKLYFVLSIDESQNYALPISTLNDAIKTYKKYTTPFAYENIPMMRIILQHQHKNLYNNEWKNIKFLFLGFVEDIVNFENNIVFNNAMRQPAYRQATSYFVKQTNPSVSSYKTTFSDSLVSFIFFDVGLEDEQFFPTFIMINYDDDFPIDTQIILDKYDSSHKNKDYIIDKLEHIDKDDFELYNLILKIMNDETKIIEFVKKILN